jgi:ABC-2 type transport system permease protein
VEIVMKKTLLVTRQEIRVTLRRKAFMLFGFGLPLLMGLIALAFMALNRDAGNPDPSSDGSSSAAEKPSIVGYVDEGGLIEILPADVADDALADERLTEYAGASPAQTALELEEIDAYYIIPPDYAASGELTYVKGTHNPIADRIDTSTMEWLLMANLLGDAELAGEVSNPFEVRVTSLKPAEESAAEDSWIVELMPTLMTLLLYMCIIMPASILVTSVTDEKKNRVMEVLMSSVSTTQFIAGKILAAGFLGLLMILAWLGVMWMVVTFGGRPLSIPAGFKLPTGILLWAGLYAFLGYAMYGSQMAGLGALAPDIKDVRGATFIVLLPLVVVYMLVIAIVIKPNGPLALFLSLFPLTSPVGMITRMSATEVPFWQGLLAAVLQLLAAVFIIRLVARLFRAQHLLSGQAFELKRYYLAMVGRA